MNAKAKTALNISAFKQKRISVNGASVLDHIYTVPIQFLNPL